MGLCVGLYSVLSPEIEIVLAIRDDVLERVGRHVLEVLGAHVDTRLLKALGDLGQMDGVPEHACVCKDQESAGAVALLLELALPVLAAAGIEVSSLRTVLPGII
jgi:hypothetical protein